jgi:hypothetical protein
VLVESIKNPGLLSGQKKMRMNDNEEGGVDMCKKFLFLALVLGLTSAAYAALPLVIGNWENGSTDGWANITPVQLEETIPPWPTLGTGSGRIHNLEGWQQGVQLNSYANYFYTPGNPTRKGFESAVRYARDIHLDVKMVASEWANYFADGGWVNAVDAVVINGDFGWTQFNTPAWYPTPGQKPLPPPYYHDWNGAADEVFHYDWTMPALGPTSYVQVYIITNYGGGLQADAGNFYVDAFTLTPEPATIAMLGLGGLALIRRKK